MSSESNNKPKISVLMPAYNAEKYIAESIESILNQTFTDFELIIVDDASKDSTWEIINRYSEKDTRIKAYRNEENIGVTKNRNSLIKKALGDYVAWQDADDISHPSRLELQHNFMQDNNNIGICGGYLEFFNQNGTIFIQKYDEKDVELRKKIFRYSPVSQGVSMIRKNVFLFTGLYNEQLDQAEDLEMTFRIGSRYEFANIPLILLKYRKHTESISSKSILKNIKSTVKVRFNAVESYGYKMCLRDKIINHLTLLFSYIPLSSETINYLFKVYRKIL